MKKKSNKIKAIVAAAGNLRQEIQADQIHINSIETAGNVQGNYLKWVFTYFSGILDCQ